MDTDGIDRIVNSQGYAPRWGWHDDHRHNDRTPAYLPAIQQVRAEFFGLIEVAEAAGALGGRCLQLGIGECDASHAVWQHLFAKGAVTIDHRIRRSGLGLIFQGADTHNRSTWEFAAGYAPYSLLFIDAGHKIDDVRRDHVDYGSLVRRGGIIAFHDSAKRPGYEDEVDVWRYLETIDGVNQIGNEVGVAWIVRK